MVQAPSTFSAKAVGGPAPGAVRLGSVSREETNLVFVFPAPGPLNYAVQMCSNLTAGYWRTVATRTASPAAGVVTVTVPALAPEAAFYRLDGLRLLNPARNGTQFQFQFLAEAGIPYRVSRNPSLTPGPWQTVTNLVGAGLLATALDMGATGATGYYRVEY